ncbi:DHA1 family chloramphenicol resistance protein-like MFS transporter [Nocardioides zeae]|uniref:DHA1 family chloramphenicol resistance protein-like MFS transporter n=1 Tax=Nocardioides zeae TaxID=1457234 RepID=A0ACC6IMZ7_9ACTN|nr:Cmx/CmrA family chloramphenicol efflux MFS transporter [Nocardioides zeae]MDR6174400.1 DHA1 family chloramphenicol resistance protein-like MFS transporter [Nocardioides zeae]MDR6212121.1 DHA1 family chloramphenicol resistance protein-like MFS transporter [Nocardioides zeae]
MTSDRPGSPPRLPLAVLVLGATIFCLGTSEFMLAGLLPDLARDLDVSIPAAGGLISGFAVGMVVGAPAMALLTLRLPRRTTLLVSAVVFAVAHLAAVVVDDYATLLATRVVAAVACATFWAVAAVTAVAISPPGATARAMAVVVGGLTVANVVGVPLGSLVGSQGGWRAAFLAVGLLTLLATVATALLVPETREVGDASYGAVLRRELRTFRRAPLWVALGTTALFQAAVFCTFSYLAPVVTDVGGLTEGWVPVVLLAFGLGSVAGVALGGRYADRNLLLNVQVSLVALAVALVVLAATADLPGAIVASSALFGIAAFSIASAINARVLGLAGDAPTLASAVNVSAFNVGNALGPALGGLVLAAGAGYRAPVAVSLVLTAGALGLALLSRRIERSPDPSVTLAP